MRIMDFVMDEDKLVAHLSDKRWRRIGLQFPEGLKPYAEEIILELKKDPILDTTEFLISGSPCYGACDVADKEFLLSGADGMIHFGHSEIPAMCGSYLIPVIFVELRSDLDARDVVEKAQQNGFLKGIIGVTTTIQFAHELPRIRDYLKGHGFEVRTGRGTDRVAHEGQVLGCSFSSATASTVQDADTHLFVGEGLFHPLGIALATGKHVIAADPRSGVITDMDAEKDRVLKQRYGAIQKLKDTEDIGVVLSTLPGQMRRELVTNLIKLGGEKGKRMTLITTPHLNPMNLMNIGETVLVSTACPRVAVDDYSLFLEHGITITTPIEFLIALGETEWEDYVLDTIE